MNRSVTGVPDRGTSGSARTTGTRPGVSTLAILLASGLALRLIIAYLLPGSGFTIDVNSFTAWANDLAKNGAYGFYDRPFFHDYTPGYLYVLWLVGLVGQVLGGIGDLIKVPAILSDVALAWLAHRLVRDLAGSERRALLAAAIVLVNPITWLDSTIWGQVDSFGVIFLLLGLRELWFDRPERAAVLATMAAVVKPQLGILVPIVAVVVIRRALLPVRDDAEGSLARAELGLDEMDTHDDPIAQASGGATEVERDRRPSLLVRLRGWEARTDRPVRIVTTGLAGLLTAAILSAPFGLSVIDLLAQVAKTAGGYAYLTVNAYNPWALFTNAAGNGLAATGSWLCDSIAFDPTTGVGCTAGQETLIGPVWAVFVGTGLLLAVIAVTCVLVARHPDRRTILVGLTVLAIAFFVVPTRVHERYLYPFFALGAVLAAVSLRWRVAYLILTLANGANIYVVLTILYPDQVSNISDWLGLGGAIRSPQGVAIVALAHLLVFLWALAQLRPAARRRLAAEAAEASVDEDRWIEDQLEPAVDDPTGVEGAPRGAGPAPWAAVAGGQLASVRPSDGLDAAVSWAPMVHEPATGTGVLGWARARLLARPFRPDRSRMLDAEPHGRFDRLDIWVVAVLVVSALVLRTWRLSDPPQMHFDEVYHARTATEFLQKWRYGMDHDIYEWTHPHLAKYAMAGGIVLFGDDQVTAQSQLDTSVRDAVVERRWADPSLPNARAGDRLYVATGSEVRAYDLATRAQVATIVAPDAVALAVDASNHTLYVGTSAGAILSVDTSVELDALRDPAGVGAGTPVVEAQAFANAGAAVRHLVVGADGSYVAAATDRLVTFDAASGERLGQLDVPGLAAIADAGTADVLVATPAQVADPAAAAAALVPIVGGDAATYRRLLTSQASEVTLAGGVTTDQQTKIEAAAEGALAGVSVEPRPRLAATGTDGVTFVAPAGATKTGCINLNSAAAGLSYVTGVDDPKLYVADGAAIAIVDLGADATKAPTLSTTMPMPGVVRDTAWDAATLMVHALGRTSDGTADTIYVIEPHANDVYADARLPFSEAAWALDVAPDYPTSDRQQILALSADGAVAAVDAGNNAFSWRLPGVLLRRADRSGSSSCCAGCSSDDARRGHRRVAGPGRRHVLRPVADRHERRLRGPLHRRRVHAVRRALDRRLAQARAFWVAMPIIGRAARTGARVQVGRAYAHRRAGDPHPCPLGPRSRGRHRWA